MPLRVIALFLSVLMLWSSVSTFELPHTPPGEVTAMACPSDAPVAGSVQQHHLDDQPSHAASDAPGECAALLPAPWPQQRAAEQAALPRLRDCVSLPAPEPGPPLRPPCAATRRA